MTGQFFFTTIAGLALSVAGFASIVTALRPGGRWTKTVLWRLRAIVGEALTITVVAVLPLPLFYLLGGDEVLTIRVMSGVITLKLVQAIWVTVRGGGEWGRRYVIRGVILLGLQLAVQAANIWFGSLALLMFGVLAWFSFPIQLLFAIVQDFQPPLDE